MAEAPVANPAPRAVVEARHANVAPLFGDLAPDAGEAERAVAVARGGPACEDGLLLVDNAGDGEGRKLDTSAAPTWVNTMRDTSAEGKCDWNRKGYSNDQVGARKVE